MGDHNGVVTCFGMKKGDATVSLNSESCYGVRVGR